LGLFVTEIPGSSKFLYWTLKCVAEISSTKSVPKNEKKVEEHCLDGSTLTEHEE